ncbi:anaerobic selenocysteine-containing dehydrogenase [Nonomuraea polychroma]|uniref:Anaerobic selenocysteine-containing dehydrogenase n=1 Tax=Nonomuraea polychroma TaxID=46176 RepID=A0A438M6S8_9ACTN|nr:molybdopterin-dependent oxidoreductase [Nonomuraea polychroma]RVX41410.1 anaerobic selenocysteine-containing dehydrogenase [Nonomuraea polychroma]
MTEGITRPGRCTLCEAMCGLRVTTSGDRVIDIRGDEDDPLSAGHICPKALALADLREDPDRLRSPVRRTKDGWRDISWEEAFDLVAGELARIRRRHGADAVAVYLGNPVTHSLGSMTHAPAFASLLGTRNRFSASSVDQLPHQVVSRLLYGNQWLLPVPDIDRTAYFLVFGANPAVSNGSLMTAPGMGRRIRALLARGGTMVVFDPRRTETAKLGGEHHFVRPGTDAALILGMVRVILEEGLARPAAYVDGLDEVRDVLAPFTPERVEAVAGVEPGTVRRVAREFAAAPSAACYGRMGVSTQRFGTLCQWGIQLLNIVTGNLDRPGGTMFTKPAVDPIRARQIDPGHQGRWRSRVRGLPEFGGELPVAALAEEIRTPGPGQVRGLLTVAGNPVLSTPAGPALDESLAGLDFMVAVDFYINETTRHAHVILPPTEPLERDHYDLIFHMLAVRNTARYVPAVFPRQPGARHDWEIFRELGRRYGRLVRSRPWRAALMLRMRPKRIVDLGLRTGPYHLSLARLRRRPHGADLGELRPSLPGRLQTPRRRVRTAPPPLVAAAEEAVAELLEPPAPGTLLLIGRRQLRGNNSWMHNSARLVKGRARHHLLMNPDDMAARGLGEGDLVNVRSPAGVLTVEASAGHDIMPGTVSLPHGYGHDLPGVRLSVARRVRGSNVNALTDPARLDQVSGTAVLNGVPVTVERCQ